jgi:hypothetical protein
MARYATWLMLGILLAVCVSLFGRAEIWVYQPK